MNKSVTLTKIQSLFRTKNLREEFIERSKIQKAVKPIPFNQWPKSWIDISFKGYPRLDRIFLSRDEAIAEFPTIPIHTVLRKRVSTRSYRDNPISIKQLSILLFNAAGIKNPSRNWNMARRFYPSGGARYPIEIYVLIHRGSDIKPGIYHYNVKQHALEIFKESNIWNSVRSCFEVEWIDKASIMIGMTAVFGRSEIKYGNRSLRHILLEAGHIGQNLYLCSTAMGLGCIALGGQVDDKFNKLINVDGETESTVYTICIGTKANNE